MKMDNIEYRTVIKYLFLKGNTPTQIKDELDSVYGDSAPSFTTVKFWPADFKRGRKSLGDDSTFGTSKNCNYRRKHRQSSPNGARRPRN